MASTRRNGTRPRPSSLLSPSPSPEAIGQLYAASPQRLVDYELLTESLGVLVPVAEDVAAVCCREFFAARPDLRSKVPPDMASQREQLLRALVALAGHADRPKTLVDALVEIGQRHAEIGFQLIDYAHASEVVIDVLRRFSGGDWRGEYESAWRRAFTFAIGVMAAAGAAPAGAPVDVAA